MSRLHANQGLEPCATPIFPQDPELGRARDHTRRKAAGSAVAATLPFTRGDSRTRTDIRWFAGPVHCQLCFAPKLLPWRIATRAAWGSHCRQGCCGCWCAQFLGSFKAGTASSASGQSDSNAQPPAPKAGALPNWSYIPLVPGRTTLPAPADAYIVVSGRDQSDHGFGSHCQHPLGWGSGDSNLEVSVI